MVKVDIRGARVSNTFEILGVTSKSEESLVRRRSKHIDRPYHITVVPNTRWATAVLEFVLGLGPLAHFGENMTHFHPKGPESCDY